MFVVKHIAKRRQRGVNLPAAVFWVAINYRYLRFLWLCFEYCSSEKTTPIFVAKTLPRGFFKPQKTSIYAGFQRFWYYSHSLWGYFPQLLFALFRANFCEFPLKFSRFSLYSLSSQPVWYCFGIKVRYQFSEKSGEKKSLFFSESDTWLCLTDQPALMVEYKGGYKGRAPLGAVNYSRKMWTNQRWLCKRPEQCCRITIDELQ